MYAKYFNGNERLPHAKYKIYFRRNLFRSDDKKNTQKFPKTRARMSKWQSINSRVKIKEIIPIPVDENNVCVMFLFSPTQLLFLGWQREKVCHLILSVNF